MSDSPQFSQGIPRKGYGGFIERMNEVILENGHRGSVVPLRGIKQSPERFTGGNLGAKHERQVDAGLLDKR